MHCNLRRGLLSTLFAGGLLAFGATAASAADTTSGSDLSASALVSAATSANTTSLSLLGGPKPSETADVAPVVDVNLGLGNNGAGAWAVHDSSPALRTPPRPACGCTRPGEHPAHP